jgi:hypothetical protein
MAKKKLTSINFPCVILERQKNKHFTINDLRIFSIVRNQKEIDHKKEYFRDPVICHYYAIVNEALRLEQILNDSNNSKKII